MKKTRVGSLVECTKGNEFFRARFRASRRTALKKLEQMKVVLGGNYQPYAYFRMRRKPIGEEIHALFGSDMEVSLERTSGKSPYDWELVAWPYGDAPMVYFGYGGLGAMGWNVAGQIRTALQFR